MPYLGYLRHAGKPLRGNGTFVSVILDCLELLILIIVHAYGPILSNFMAPQPCQWGLPCILWWRQSWRPWNVCSLTSGLCCGCTSTGKLVRIGLQVNLGTQMSKCWALAGHSRRNRFWNSPELVTKLWSWEILHILCRIFLNTCGEKDNVRRQHNVSCIVKRSRRFVSL